jgi:prepilin-type N-terminal cleavage/methylation domain-containing protein
LIVLLRSSATRHPERRKSLFAEAGIREGSGLAFVADSSVATRLHQNDGSRDWSGRYFVSRGARAGFTLIEIVIAVLIMALLATAAALSFDRPLNRARTLEAIEQVRYLDASSRDFARRFGRSVEIAFDLSENRLERREGAGHEAAYGVNVASPMRVEAVWTGREQIEDGEVMIAVSAKGLSQTYAVKLNGPEGVRWVLVSGVSGESAVYGDDEQVRAIFAKISARGDAD